jgi:dipeptidyl aminopeptidase/acylaminoacyl peptidase
MSRWCFGVRLLSVLLPLLLSSCGGFVFSVDPPFPCQVDSSVSGHQPQLDGPEFAWSPNGKHIAVSTVDSNIYVLSLKDSRFEPRFLSEQKGVRLTWLPDNQRISFKPRYPEGPLPISILDTMTGVVTETLVSDIGPQFTRHKIINYLWDVNHDQIVLVRHRDSYLGAGKLDLFTVASAGTDYLVSEVAALEEASGVLSWSPDGMTLLYVSQHDIDGRLNPNWQWNLFAIDLHSRDKRRLVVGDGCEKEPDWSPDSIHIAFSSSRNGNWDIFVVSAAGGVPHNLTNTFDLDEHQATWSPDGSQIAYIGFQQISYSEVHQHLYIVNTLTGESTQLTYGHEMAVMPRWSPDGTHIAFLVYEPNGRRWYLDSIRADGREQVRLSNLP